MFKIWILTLALCASFQDEDIKQWSMWRGPNRDGLSPDKGLLQKWPDGGPSLLWKSSAVGGGWSSVSLWDDRVFTLGDFDRTCYLLCLDAKDGKEIWRARVCDAGTHGDYPGPRSTPSTDGRIVIALGETGDLVCVDFKTGKPKWKKHMEKDFGGRMMSTWKWTESPLLDGKLVVVTPGGPRGALAALDKSSGRMVWQSAQLKGSEAAYTSLVPIEIGNIRQYLVMTNNTVAGVVAKNGKVAWEVRREGKTAVIPTPIYYGGIVFVTSGYNVGCHGYRVTKSGNGFQVREIYSGRQMVNHHGGCIRAGDFVYGVDEGGSLKCLALETGKEVWAGPRLGKGSIAYADGHLIYRSENKQKGTILLVEATSEGYREKGRFDQPDLSGEQTWPHPVVFGGKLYIRDQKTLLCYDLKETE